jgi:hypothetical protein
VVKDIVKAYYDKKAKKTQGTLTADDKRYDVDHSAATAAAIQPPAVKPVDAPAAVPTHAANATPR